MFFPQNSAQEEAQPVSGSMDAGLLLPVVMTTNSLVDATEGANVAHGDNGDGMVVDPVVVPAREEGSTPVGCEGEVVVVSVITYL